jgi:hypothetical protein
MTYPMPVYISDDHFDINTIFEKKHNKSNQKESFNINDYYEEMCILYVAITRTAGEIQFSDKLKEYLLTRHNYFSKVN